MGFYGLKQVQGFLMTSKKVVTFCQGVMMVILVLYKIVIRNSPLERVISQVTLAEQGGVTY